MNVHKLIAEVHKRGCLWKVKHVRLKPHQRQEMDKVWGEVAKKFHTSRNKVKTKWRNLRDAFRKELKVCCKEGKRRSTWLYFDSLSFLIPTYKSKPILLERRLSCDSYNSEIKEESYTEETLLQLMTPPIKSFPPKANVLPSIHESYALKRGKDSVGPADKSQEEAGKFYSENNRVPLIDVPNPLAIRPQITGSSFTSIKGVYTIDENDDLNLSVGTENQSPFKKGTLGLSDNSFNETKFDEKSMDENDNLSFLRSLLPFMKKLDPVQQLRVRMRFQESLLDELGA